nr:MAG TPA: hypothetical protein [Caudoviricetes sp.]
MRQHDFPENEGGHFRIRFIVEQVVQRVVSGFQVAVVRRLIYTQRQTGHRFRDYPDTGVHRGKLNGCLRGDGFACAAGAEVEHRSGTDAVAGLVPRTEQCREGVSHKRFLPFCDCWCSSH